MKKSRYLSALYTLKNHPETRDSDVKGYTTDAYIRGVLTVEEAVKLEMLMIKAGNTETWRRARQLVQAKIPELGPTNPEIAKARNEKEQRARATKGESIANSEDNRLTYAIEKGIVTAD